MQKEHLLTLSDKISKNFFVKGRQKLSRSADNLPCTTRVPTSETGVSVTRLLIFETGVSVTRVPTKVPIVETGLRLTQECRQMKQVCLSQSPAW